MKKLTILLIIFTATLSIHGQTASIQGTVVSEEGTPIPFANLLLLNTNKGATTTASGFYEISDAETGEQTIQVTFIGYKSIKQTITIIANKTTTTNFTLIKTATQLKEVSITATGVKKSTLDIPGAVSIIDNKAIVESGAQNIGEIITRAPGVKINLSLKYNSL